MREKWRTKCYQNHTWNTARRIIQIRYMIIIHVSYSLMLYTAHWRLVEPTVGAGPPEVKKLGVGHPCERVDRVPLSHVG